MVADYLLTNQAARLDERLTTMAAHLEAATGKVPSDTAVRAFLGVDAAFLQAGLAAMRREHGSLDGYLDAIGVDAAQRERVCEALLA